jgi:hypothetical protein
MTNRAIFPGADEICDEVDNDCDGLIDETCDNDGDGFSVDDGDCNDQNPFISPGSPEICGDGIDNDCDGLYDERDCDYDRDGDSYPVGVDCDDNNPDVNPGAVEVCDDVDNNCDGQIDEGFDLDEDGYNTCTGDCDDNDPDINPEAEEICDGVDNDCDGIIDEGLTYDADEDGFTSPLSCGGSRDDCDDLDPTVYPGAPELCDGIDNDCDGYLSAFEIDNDGDGYVECLIDQGGWDGDPSVLGGNDCDDNDPFIYPGAEEVCDGLDNDCDALIDRDDPDIISMVIEIPSCNIIYYGYSPTECIELSVTITGGHSPFTYEWSNREITSAITVCPSIDTYYSVTVTDSKGCTVEAITEVKVIDVRCGRNNDRILLCRGDREICSHLMSVPHLIEHGFVLGSCNTQNPCNNNISLEKITSNSQGNGEEIIVYPNPASYYLNILFGDQETYTMKLINSQGTEILNQHKMSSFESINLNKIPNGIYFLAFYSKDEFSYKKLIINR